MHARILPTAALFAVLIAAGPALAQPVVHASWEGCVPVGGTPVTERITTTPGLQTLTFSGSGWTQRVRGIRVALEIRSPGGLPPAWRFDAGGCQDGRLELLTSPFSKSCPAIGSLPSSTMRFSMGSSGASALLEIDLLFQGLITPNPSTPYTIARLVFDHSASTATGSGAGCEGIERPVCLAIVRSEAIYEDGSTATDLVAAPAVLRWNDPDDLTACSAGSLRDVRIEELFAHCANGLSGAQYLELSVPPQADAIATDLRVRTFDRAGAVILDGIAAIPGGIPTPSSPSRRWLVGTSPFSDGSGLSPDLLVPHALDPQGGRVLFYDGRPGGDVVQDLRYGAGEAVRAPPLGGALHRDPDGTYQATIFVSPTRWDGATAHTIECPAPAGSGFVIREVGLQCVDGSNAGLFVEVESRIEGEWPGPLDLVVRDPGGGFIARASGLFGASVGGVVVPGLRRWLVAGPGFAADNGVEPDTRFGSSFFTFRPLVFSLVGGAGFTQTFHTVSLDPALFLPPPGRSAVVLEDGSVEVSETPTPEIATGDVAVLAGCFCPDPACGAGEFDAVRLDEVLAGCAAGDTTSRFIELRPNGETAAFSAHARLEIRDRNGAVQALLSDLFPGRSEGETWSASQAWLLAGPQLPATFGVAGDRAIPALDPLQGSLRFYDARAPHRTISDLHYGPAETVGRLDQGRSAIRAPDDSWTTANVPHPANAPGIKGSPVHCPCPSARFGFGWSSPLVETPLTVLDSLDAGSRLRFDRIQGRSEASGSGTIELSDRYVIRGLPQGQPVNAQARWSCTGWVETSCGPVHGCRPVGVATLDLFDVDSTHPHSLPEGATALPVTLPITERAGEPFFLGWRLRVGAAGYAVQLSFDGLPPGAWVESCMGYRSETAVATRPSLVSAAAEPDVVRLEWSALEPDVTSAVVERRTGDIPWAVIGMAQVERTRVTFEDRTVEGSVRYAYRLTWNPGTTAQGSTEEAWIEVPARAFAARLAGGTMAPGAFELALSLPDRQDIRLELYDLRGRRLASRTWTPERAGTVDFSFAPGRALGPGVYWIRVLQGDRRAIVRAVALGR